MTIAEVAFNGPVPIPRGAMDVPEADRPQLLATFNSAFVPFITRVTDSRRFIAS